MKEYPAKIMIRVTANGCGLPLTGATLLVDGCPYEIPESNNGFSQIISVFSSNEKGVSKYCTAEARCEGFNSLICSDIPLTSGYLTIWNMPLERKSNKVKKIQNNEKTYR